MPVVFFRFNYRQKVTAVHFVMAKVYMDLSKQNAWYDKKSKCSTIYIHHTFNIIFTIPTCYFIYIINFRTSFATSHHVATE